MAFRLPKLQRNVQINAKDGYPSAAFHIWWQQIAKRLETSITEIQEALDLAEAAQESADDARNLAARTGSYTSPTVVLTGTDAGATASITIASHTRIYPSNDDFPVDPVSVTGGSLTGLAFSTTYYVYYDDETLSDTTPVFQSTTTAATAQVGAGPGRHFVGVVTTPADGGGNTGGTGGTPPGGGGGPLP